MDKQEFLLLIPAIIYGVAIVDLIKIFGHKKNYIEMVGWGIFIMMLVIFSWMELYQKLEAITNSNLSFFLIIGQAILLTNIAKVITPEREDENTEVYFFEVQQRFFLLLFGAAIYALVIQYFVFDDHSPSRIRPLALVVNLVMAYSQKFWLRISILGMVLVISVLRIFTDVLV
jgi:hypothetical protein